MCRCVRGLAVDEGLIIVGKKKELLVISLQENSGILREKIVGMSSE